MNFASGLVDITANFDGQSVQGQGFGDIFLVNNHRGHGTVGARRRRRLHLIC